MIQWFSRLVVHTFFREVIIGGRDRLPEGGPVIFTPNHPNGLLDPLLMFVLSPKFCLRFVAKAPLFKIPVFGTILKSMGAIPVVRRIEAGGEVDYTTFLASCVEALAERDSLVIFPEGRSLPQAYLAPLRTGPARLFFLAQQRGIRPCIVPVGLNYERVTIFRSAVLIAIAPPIDTARYESQYRTDPQEAVRALTADIADSLQRYVIQAETYRDRELMVLLERISSGNEEDSWLQRFSRLKEFEKGLKRLRPVCPQEIDRLRRLLERYRRLSIDFGIDDSAKSGKPSERSLSFLFALLAGALPASIGWILNWLPYHATDLLVRWTRKDESDAATFKVIYSLFLFPCAYLLEGALVAHLWGWVAAIIFFVSVIPLSYFTLSYFEWRDRVTTGYTWIGGKHRVARQLERLRQRIGKELQALAARSELRAE